ncbi:MAG: septum formation initiator family protein [Bacteriovorax sp.]|nr:septum formation initiator family protein [Bacteriovorax sp.]
MEFSYDRSKDSLRKPEERTAQTQQQTPPQPSGVRAGPDLNTVDPSTIANERLRKAIERNRAKQGIRATQATQVHEQATQGEAPQYEEEQPAREIPREAPRMRARERVSTPPPPPNNTSVVSRRSVAKPEDTEFIPVKRTQRKVASQISYTTTSTRKKQKFLDPKYQGWLVKGSWIFCGVMVLRLIFAAGGVTDFYSQKNSVNARVAELSDIKKENMQLVREIERMRSDTGFQKKLVRDNLGFIAADEFLVLFPK